MNIAYENQLDIKAHHVLNSWLMLVSRSLSSWASQANPNTTAYRNKMEYTFGDNAGRTADFRASPEADEV